MLLTHFQPAISLNKSIVWIGSCLTYAVPLSLRVVLPEIVSGFHFLLILASFPLQIRNTFHLIMELISLPKEKKDQPKNISLKVETKIKAVNKKK